MKARIGLLVFCCCVIITLFGVIGNSEATKAKPQRCNGSNECGFNQCCANKNLRGRKRRSLSFAGICQPYGQYDAECAVKNQNANENVFPGWCPCTEPLNCKKNGNIEVPFGEKESTLRFFGSSLFHSRIVDGINDSVVRESLQNGTIISSPFRNGFLVVYFTHRGTCGF